MAADQDVRQLLLQVDAQVELARRSLGTLERDVAGFQRNVDKHLSQVEKSFGTLSGAMATFKGALTGLVAGVGIDGIARLGKAVLDFADDLGTAAERVNISVERFQTLKGAFRELEISGEAFNKILDKLIQAQGDVANGTENGATKALDELGVTTDILSGKIQTTDELLDAVAVGLGKINDPARRAALAGDLVGSKLGPALAAALGDGGKALKASEQAFRDAGTVISEEYIATLAEANETFDKFVEQTTQRAVIWSARLIEEARAIKSEMADLPALFRFSPAGIAVAAFRARNRVDPSETVAPGEQVSGARFDPATGQFTFANRPDPQAAAARARKQSERAKRTAASPKSPAFDPFFSVDVSGVSADLARQFEDRFKVDPQIDAMLKERAGKTLEERVAEIDEIKEADLRRIEQVAEAEAAANAEREQFYDNISRNLSQAIIYGQSLGDALVSAFKAAAAEALASGLFDFLKAGGSGGFGGLVASIGAAFGGARANGGPVTPGRAYLVGERGPEPFIPSVPGMILPNSALRSMGGGQQQIAVTVSAEPGLKAEVAMIGAQSGQAAALSVVKSARNRGIDRI